MSVASSQGDGLYAPALPPPPGVFADVNNPSNRNEVGEGLLITCLILTCAVALLYVHSRVVCIRKVFLEDYFALAAFGCWLAYAGMLQRHIIGGHGFYVHIWEYTLKDLVDFNYTLYIFMNFYSLNLLFVKAAILLSWMRIFVPKGTRTKFWWTCLGVCVLNAVYYVAAIFISNFSCTPREKSWDFTVPGTCIDINKFYYGAGFVNLFINVMILVLPHRVIWRLNMSWRQKFNVAVAFIIGIIACLAAGLHIWASVFFFESPDVTYNISLLSMFVMSEMTSGLLVLSGPAVVKATGHLKAAIGSKLSASMILRTLRERASDYSSSVTEQPSMEHMRTKGNADHNAGPDSTDGQSVTRYEMPDRESGINHNAV